MSSSQEPTMAEQLARSSEFYAQVHAGRTIKELHTLMQGRFSQSTIHRARTIALGLGKEEVETQQAGMPVSEEAENEAPPTGSADTAPSRGIDFLLATEDEDEEDEEEEAPALLEGEAPRKERPVVLVSRRTTRGWECRISLKPLKYDYVPSRDAFSFNIKVNVEAPEEEGETPEAEEEEEE